MKTAAIIALLILIIIFAPLITIWSVNTLFGTLIPYNLATWFASFWLTAAVVNKGSKK